MDVEKARKAQIEVGFHEIADERVPSKLRQDSLSLLGLNAQHKEHHRNEAKSKHQHDKPQHSDPSIVHET